ncbi:Rhamnogalacturonan endolyase [Bertholletia excelsa]
MEKARWKKHWSLSMGCLCLLLQMLWLTSLATAARTTQSANNNDLNSSPPLRLHKLNGHVVMDNGIVNVTLSTPGGMVTQIQYHGIDNVLANYKETGRGYWDIIWERPGQRNLDTLDGTSFRVIKEDRDQIEVSFVSTWNPSYGDVGRPLNVDKRYIMLRGSSGFYTYAIFDRPAGWPALAIDEARVAFKIHPTLFDYMSVSDTRQRFMPTANDRIIGEKLAYPEAVLLTDPENDDLKGEVDDKYMYSADVIDNQAHGWMCFEHGVGFWVITPSNEFRTGGPFKQELTSHVGPTSLAMFFSNHYAGILRLYFEEGEPWKKVLGPVFIYLNSASSSDKNIVRTTLWDDAKQQMVKETQIWPYNFPVSEDFPKANERGTVYGRLLVRDRYLREILVKGSGAYVGLANPGEVRSFQTDTKGYQFWTRADAEGYFAIKNIRAGNYSLYAWVPGTIGDYKYETQINVSPGREIRLGHLVYYPPRAGPTLWEIGIPDRTAAEFYVPDPEPNLVNPLFINSTTEKFRQYGLWDRYSALYPENDLVYTVGQSNYQKDWFFAHVTRKMDNGNYVSTTWRIVFDLATVTRGTYTLRLALASAAMAELQVRINNPTRERPNFTTGRIGKDNAIARHGIHGLYWLYSVDIPSIELVKGTNTIYLRQSRGGGPFTGLMYDYIRLEGPPRSS